MALIHESFLKQVMTGTGQTDSIRVNNGKVIVDSGGSTWQVEVKAMNGTWVPLCSADGTAYSYTGDACLDIDGSGLEYRVNVTTYSADLHAEIHPST